jgi:plastocyanin
MKNLRFCSYLIALSILFPLSACEKEKQLSFHSVPVNIENCGSKPDWVSVREGDQINWQPNDLHDYTIRFSDAHEPTGNPLTVKHGASNPAHTIRGHHGCVETSSGEFDCKYTVTRDNESRPCGDPGVHISR